MMSCIETTLNRHLVVKLDLFSSFLKHYVLYCKKTLKLKEELFRQWSPKNVFIIQPREVCILPNC